MKYNKRLQKRLNLNINDYKECFLLYTPIEIVLKIFKNEYGSGKFINIPDEEKKYYHIYFDNSNVEIDSKYLKNNHNVNTIKIKIDYKIKSLNIYLIIVYALVQ